MWNKDKTSFLYERVEECTQHGCSLRWISLHMGSWLQRKTRPWKTMVALKSSRLARAKKTINTWLQSYKSISRRNSFKLANIKRLSDVIRLWKWRPFRPFKVKLICISISIGLPKSNINPESSECNWSWEFLLS